MSGFTRRAKGLEQTFPLSGPSLHEPGELSEFVQLVHLLFGPMVRIGAGERQGVSANGAAGVANLTVVTCPLGVVRMVEFAEASHDDAAARHMSWRIVPFNVAAGTVTIQSSKTEAGGADIALGVPFALKRPVLLGPGDVLEARAAALAVGNFLDAKAVIVDYAATDLAWGR